MLKHDDVLARLEGVPGCSDLALLILADRVVECDVEIRCWDVGSLDPLVVAIREQLSKGDSLTLEALSEAVRAPGASSERVIAEVLAILVRTGEVIDRKSRGVQRFESTGTDVWRDKRARELVFTKRYKFTPRARRLATRMKETARSKVNRLSRSWHCRWLELPDHDAIYSEDVLRETIKDACAEHFLKERGGRIPLSYVEAESRIEPLERSHLQKIRPEFMSAEVQRVWVKEDSLSFHRCYLLPRTTGGGGNVLVYDYYQGPEDSRYTEYLTDLIRKFPQIEDELYDASDPVGKFYGNKW